ncbi:peptidoglycan DD-metalloendopeptidase family protein [Candidatus Peregrinibacteria bacterium]|nr:peptidoglycan DD-metalloendopeptidase family protein [Candidatus Peregrinibacteria bacterium]
MSASEATKKKCCRWSFMVAIIALAGITYVMADTTAEFREKKRVWLANAIHDVQAVNENDIYPKPVYLTTTELSKEFKEILFKEILSSEPKVEHDSIRGIYITASTAASANFMTMVDQLIASGGNSLVIDVEMSGGQLAFTPENPWLTAINPGSTKLNHLSSLIKELHEKDIYVIARQVIFNDPYTASRKPEWRIRYQSGALYDGRWLDPSHPEVQEYNFLITREVAEMGFDEIQYDYIRFPDSYHYGLNYYYDESQQERWEIINDFLAKAHLITQEYQIDLGVDVFGATIYGDLDWNLVGQKIDEIAKNVDVIYPMVYPSHISPGYNGFYNPYGAPYSFIYDSIGKFIKAANGNAEIRPWIQGFAMRIPNYGPWFVAEQIKATYDTSANDFVIWNASNNYSTSWSSLGMLPPEPPEPLSPPLENAAKRVTKKPFGIKISPNDSPVSPERFSGYHTGTDFEILEGEEDKKVTVYAICSGPLALKRDLNGYGGVMVQQCYYGEQEITVVYGHLNLSSIDAEAGDMLEEGQKIGILGKGFSEETDGERKHLHLGIHRGKEVSFLGYVNSAGELSAWLDPEKLIAL